MVSTTYLYNELSKYGISSSGNIQTDIAKIKKLKQANGESTSAIDNFAQAVTSFKRKQSEAVNQNQQGMPELPWNSLMQSLGIELQGSKEADFTAIESKIAQMESMNLSADQQASLDALKAQFEKIKETEANKPQRPEGQNQMSAQAGQKPQGMPQGEPEWFSLMQTLGIQPQGSKEADMSAISTRLSQMKNMSLSPEQKANLESLQAQFEKYQNS